MPATVETLKTYLGIDPATSVDAEAMGFAVDAANAKAVEMRPDVTTAAGVVLGEWPAYMDQGALTQAARWYGRRGSVAGVAAFADTGVSMLPRIDPDVRWLWGLGEYQASVIA